MLPTHRTRARPVVRGVVAALATAILLATPAPATEVVVGQVACSECWTEADRTRVPYGGPADRACAARCARAGIPPALAIREDDGSFRTLRIDGDPPEGVDSWLDLVGTFVRAELAGRSDGGVRVASLTLLDRSPWPDPVEAADPASLSWPDLAGVEQGVTDLEGRIAVVNFWATWCKPCIEEMPVLARIQNDYAPLGVQVVGIAADAPDRAADVLAFARDRGVSFPIWLGATTPDMAAFGVGPSLPATVVLDRDGRVVHTFPGVVEDAALREVLDATLDVPTRTASAGGAGHLHGKRRGDAALVPS